MCADTFARANITGSYQLIKDFSVFKLKKATVIPHGHINTVKNVKRFCKENDFSSILFF